VKVIARKPSYSWFVALKDAFVDLAERYADHHRSRARGPGLLEAGGTPRLGALQMRQVLSDPTTGNSSADPAMDHHHHARYRVHGRLRAGFPRRFRGPHSGPISASPDVTVRPTPVANPQAAHGEEAARRTALGYEVEAGQDNYVYVRVRNRGDYAADDVEVTVYWSVANFVNFDNFRAFIRENNNVTWRNINVVNAVPDPPDRQCCCRFSSPAP
jgi:hypothetical protein